MDSHTLFVRLLAGLLSLAALPRTSTAQCAPGEPCDVGAWAGPWDWNYDICSSYACTLSQGTVEFYHGGLIPTGRYTGMIMLLRVDTPANCISTGLLQTWIFNPAAPARLLKVDHAQVPADMNCGGQTWDRRGRLVVAGGSDNVTLNKRTFRFDPRQLGDMSFPAILPGQPGGGGPTYPPCAPITISAPAAWTQLGDMAIPRYYATVITLIRWAIQTQAGQCLPSFSNGLVVMGGPPHSDINGMGGVSEGNEVWEALDPENPSGAWSCPLLPEGYSSSRHGQPTQYPLHQQGPWQQYERLPISNPPSPLLDTYPRAVQIAAFDSSNEFTTGTGQVFIAGDSNTVVGEPEGGYGPAKTGTETWTMKIPYGIPLTPNRWELHRSTPLNVKHHYGSCATISVRKRNNGTWQYDRILVFGGSHRDPVLGNLINQDVAEFIPGVDAVNAQRKDKTPMLSKRLYPNAVVLPDGKILIVGGNQQTAGSDCGPGSPEFRPELYDPADEPTQPGSTRYLKVSNTITWPGVAPSPMPRMYHSMAMLLPDARVVVVGGRVWQNNTCPPPGTQVYPDSRLSGEVFSPPYLFWPGSQPAARPSIDDLSGSTTLSLSTATVTNTFNIDVTTVAGPVGKITLARPASLTHHFDTDQRHIELDFSVLSGGPVGPQQLRIKTPREEAAPQGYYMLFILEQKPSGGPLVPSVATFIRLL